MRFYPNNLNGFSVFKALALVSMTIACQQSYAFPVSQITFNNHTDLALNSSIAGFPGYGIDANTSKAIGYEKINFGCYMSVKMSNCPIQLTNRSNGELVASVTINALTAGLTQPPVIHGHYGEQYAVNGWELTPIREITIVQK